MTKPTLLSCFLLLLAGSFRYGTAANLRASNIGSTSLSSETVRDEDLMSIRSYLVVGLDGYALDDLDGMTPEKQAVVECAFHTAFDEVHGDKDGIYLAGQEIVATDEDPGNDADYGDGPEDSKRASFIDWSKRRKYRRPRYIPVRPLTPPPPRRAPLYKRKTKWATYWKVDGGGMCRLCPDDDALKVVSGSFLLNTYDTKKAKDEEIASDYVFGEASMNAIADAMRKHLIEGTCVAEGDDYFEYIERVDVYPISQAEFESTVAAIAAFKETRKEAVASHNENEREALDKNEGSSPTGLASPPLVEASLPFYYGTLVASDAAATSASRHFRIGLSGIACGPWNNQDLLDVNSALHNSINSLEGLSDKGHTIDKIVGGATHRPRPRNYTWGCGFDLYSRLDVAGEMSDSALDDIGDSLCSELYWLGGNRFEHAIDCGLEPLSVTEYNEAVAVTIAADGNAASGGMLHHNGAGPSATTTQE
ncbi:unnamed protein product [Pseudo-nitzschia multistriata]|uniref:Uncharacterized protein n=1 Tax=Pseudo-nitzschia multistriata TaxID=183589 RepID=A0A448ZLH7_9STRA|nr:unnamed protein product [Pseudo-nitzschia multistriata]